jgi:hypothetical protein
VSGITEQKRCPTCGALHPRKRTGPFNTPTNLPESLVRTLAIWAFNETVLELDEMRATIEELDAA